MVGMAAARRRLHSGEFVREHSLERLDRATLDRESRSDLVDVPATVVCAFCGDADCNGCEDDGSRSGIISIIAWERTQSPALARLWSTARSTTRDAESFFELMPDGPLLPALRFAAICELLASSAVFAVFIGIAGLMAPEWLRHLAFDPAARSTAARAIVLGLPAFAGLAVLAHAAHGLTIDVGARRQGARGARARALRFGLYACGWDLVMGPIGAVVVALKEGLRPALGLASALSGLPTRATNAFLRGCYRLDAERSRKALRISYVGAAAATFGVALVVVVAVVAALMG